MTTEEPTHPVIARQRLCAALELLARHVNPPPQPGDARLPEPALVQGCELEGARVGAGVQPHPLAAPSHAPVDAPVCALGYGGWVNALAVLADGRFLSAGDDSRTQLLHPEHGCQSLWANPPGLSIYADAAGVQFHRGRRWQTVEHGGHLLPCDPQLYGYTRYLDAKGATQAAWRCPELIEWRDGQRTLLLRWPHGYDWQSRLGRVTPLASS
jgi:hypothetical protein